MSELLSKVWKPLVSMLVFAFLWNTIAIENIIKVVGKVRLEPLLLALGVFLLAQIVSAQRFVYIMLQLKRKVPLSMSVRIDFIGLWFNQILPTGLGGDVVKVMALKSHLGLSRTIRGILLDRISGLIMLMFTIIILLPLYQSILGNDALTISLGVLTVAFFSTLIIAIYFSSKSRVRKFIPRPLRFIALLLQDIRRFRKGPPFYQQFWTSLLVHLNGITTYALIGTALHINVNFIIYFLVVPLVFLIALIPISFAGWGIRETGSVGLFGLIGVPSEEAFAMAVIFGLLLIVAGLPGVLIWFFQRNSHTKM